MATRRVRICGTMKIGVTKSERKCRQNRDFIQFVVNFFRFRQLLMKEMLKNRRWTVQDVQRNLNSQLHEKSSIKGYNAFRAVTFDYDNGRISFELEPCEEGQSCAFTLADLKELLSLGDIKERHFLRLVPWHFFVPQNRILKFCMLIISSHNFNNFDCGLYLQSKVNFIFALF